MPDGLLWRPAAATHPPVRQLQDGCPHLPGQEVLLPRGLSSCPGTAPTLPSLGSLICSVNSLKTATPFSPPHKVESSTEPRMRCHLLWPAPGPRPQTLVPLLLTRGSVTLSLREALGCGGSLFNTSTGELIKDNLKNIYE